MEYVTTFPEYFVNLLQGLGQTQLIEAVVIALFFGLAASTIGGAIFLPVISTIVYLAVDAVVPALMAHQDIVMPTFDVALLEKAVALYVVFLVASGIVYGIKRIFVRN